MSVDLLISRVSQAGFAIVVKDGQPSLKRQRGEKPLSPAILEELKSRRVEVLEWFASAQANNPENSIRPQKAPATTAEPGQTIQCQNCPKIVDPVLMMGLTYGLWMYACGLEKTRGDNFLGCPYRKSSH